jgi:hypothetical protein
MTADKGVVSKKRAFIFFCSSSVTFGNFTQNVLKEDRDKSCPPSFSIILQVLIIFFLLNPFEKDCQKPQKQSLEKNIFTDPNRFARGKKKDGSFFYTDEI